MIGRIWRLKSILAALGVLAELGVAAAAEATTARRENIRAMPRWGRRARIEAQIIFNPFRRTRGGVSSKNNLFVLVTGVPGVLTCWGSNVWCCGFWRTMLTMLHCH